MLDIKIEALQVSESPRYTKLVLETLPLALELHKSLFTTGVTLQVNKEL